MAVERLSEADIDAAAAELGWRRDGDRFVKRVERTDFAGAVRFVNQVAELAEARNHHPDIAVSWNKVDLVLSTHSAGGITQADVDLARAIDELG